MLRKSQLHFRKSLTIWSFVLFILVSSVYVEAAKAPRRSGQKGKPNHDAIALSYGGGRKPGSVQQHQYQSKQVYPQAASAPQLPNNNHNNKPIGWNIPASNTPVQQKTVSNTNTGFQTPAHNPGYPTQNYAAPPYNTHTQYSQHPPSNSGPPPAYPHSGPPPAYSAPIGAPNTGYPQQGLHTQQQGGYPQQGLHPQQSVGGYNPQQGGYHQQPGYPQGVNNPHPSYQQPIGYNGQQTGSVPVINNYYQQPQAGGSGSSIAKNALLLGAGGLAGAAIYGALKPGEESKTVIIHDTVPSQPPNVLPAAAAPAAVQTPETNVPLAQAPSNVPLAQPNVPLAQPPSNIPLAQPSPNVPLAPMPDTFGISQPSPNVPLAPMPDTFGIGQSTVPNMPGLETTISNEPIVPLAPMSDSNITLPKITEQRSSNNNITTNAETPASTSVPAETNPSLQAHLKGQATHLKAFNISVYAAISMILAKLLI